MYLSTGLLTAALLSAGCKPRAEKPEETQSGSEQLHAPNKDAMDRSKDIGDYAYSQRSEFVARMQVQLRDLNLELDALIAKAEKASESAKTEASQRLQALREKITSLKAQIEAAESSSESTWAGVKSSAKKGYEELKDGLEQARQWLSDKIAP